MPSIWTLPTFLRGVVVDIGVFLLLGVRAVFGVPDDIVDFVDSLDDTLRGVRGEPDDFVDFVDSLDDTLRGVRGEPSGTNDDRGLFGAIDFLVPGRGVLGDFGASANDDRGLLTDDAIETLLDPRLGVLGDFGGGGGARCDDCDFMVCCDSASDSSGK
eukprot:CAMPEP_0113476868 /NCGR_PEP_ID=MMETSP0014_2-20120614/19901_1 /TAXON_ID=2857 /ORGANISM="Nitzschia sp." /LENGTH=157 /DNA_ID=CAMNT_0000369919 /DNA_START=142 /DNA_END=615 /DNA_ORIENTATION=+ /assembly_acc=CAM_ASM_000159